MTEVPIPGQAGDRFLATYDRGAPGQARLICQWCGQECSVQNPTPPRLHSIRAWHRCGRPGSRWNEGDDSAAAGSLSAEAAPAHAVTLGWTADGVEAESVETYHDDRVFKNAQRLAEQLHIKLSAVAEHRALALRRPPVTPDRPTYRPAHLAGGRH